MNAANLPEFIGHQDVSSGVELGGRIFVVDTRNHEAMLVHAATPNTSVAAANGTHRFTVIVECRLLPAYHAQWGNRAPRT